MNDDVLSRVRAVGPRDRSKQEDLRIELTPDQQDALGEVLGCGGENRQPGWLVNTLISRVEEIDPLPEAVGMAARADDLRKLAGVADDADAGEVFNALLKKYRTATAGQDKGVIRRARVASRKETA